MKTKRLKFLFHLLLAVCIHTAGITTATAQALEVLPVNPFYSGAQATNFFKRSDGSYFFFATDGTNGLHLWKTDGTTAGTVQLQAPAPYSAGFSSIGLPSPTFTTGKNWLILNDELYFVIDGTHLFCSSGNTLRLLTASASQVSELTASGNIVYFKNIEDAGSLPATVSLWKTDGTTAGTQRLKAFDGGNGNSRASFQVKNITNVNGTAFFIAGAAADGIGYALYKSDGTTAGTVLVKDINTVDTNLTASDLYAAGRYLYFKANSSGTQAQGKEWWISNGTPAGTYQITHFGGFNNGSISATTIAHNDTLYIATPYGSPTHSRQIWKLTPDPSNPDSIYYEAQVNTVSLIQMMDGKLYFSDADIAYATRRFYAGGRSRRDTVLLQLGAYPQSIDPANTFYPLNGYYYYVARVGPSVYNLWRTNGTAEGTTLVSNATKIPSLMTKVGNAIYFRAVDINVAGTTAFNIWKSDGTTEGTKKVADRIFPNQVAAAGTDGTYYYFTSTDSVWTTNGDTVINMPLGSAATVAGVRPTGIYPTTNKLVVTAKLSTGTSNANVDLFAGGPAFQPQPQTITFSDTTVTYGDADFLVGATVNSGLDITYQVADPTVATITNGTLHILKSGTTTITASQPGNGSSWLPAADVTATLTINKAALTITADDKTKAQGDPNPVFTASFSGFVNGDTTTVLIMQPAFTTTATQASVAGTYPVTASGAAAENYTITYVNGTLTVTPPVQQPQTITFAAITKTYGEADFAPGATVTSGLPVTYTSDNPSVATVVNGNIHIAGAGMANITASQPGNDFWFPATDVTVILTVNKAALTITAEDKSKAEGSANPPLTVTYSGFVNGETAAVLTASASVSTTATQSSLAGTYPITASGAAAANYTIAYVNGILTVNARIAQSITFGDIIKTYGNADFDPGATASSGLSVTYTSDNPAVATVVNGQIHIAGTGTANITASQSGNDTYSPADGITRVLTVNKAVLNIRAEDKSRFQDEPNPSLAVTYTGFVNGEAFTSLSTQPAIITTAAMGSAPGTYPITVSGATADNYVITYTEGTFTVKALPVSEDKVDAVFIGSSLRVNVYSAKVQKAVLQLADITGRVLLTQDLSLVNGLNTYQLPVFNIAGGAYIVLVRGEGLKLSDKIIK
ncbi:MBG domain-containing protein [Chitinophaga barathri]|uniref:MBG domain-containing protein n=1 Tax=Chitinophaga barathri TaxID=1647451 RepID=A0A3N4ME54_9BACT|nr:MBG domain-containing protein [Chitinophaga barathri]RPD42061.1 hypothetical protein EG028_07880 [Chitinophaga barathri]